MENLEVNNTASPAVNHPAHYNMGKLEVIDVIEAFDLNFSEGNALKYLLRYKFKNANRALQEEDLRKAIFYIERLIKNLKSPIQ